LASVASIDQILQYIRSAAELIGLGVTWKAAGGHNPFGIPRELHDHRAPFCMAAKATRSGPTRCIGDCVDGVHSESVKYRRPYLKRCHAGAIELVIPILGDERFDGALYLGPMRAKKGGQCPYAACRKLWASLRLCDERALRSATDMLALIADHIARARLNATGSVYLPESAHPRIQRGLEYMRANLYGPLRCAAVARHSFLSPSRFMHLFKQEVGMTFCTYVTSARIEEARRLLLTSQRRIGHIAAQVGFENPNYFSSTFKKHTGQTPGRFRRNAREHTTP
jgi:AraC-like DNA-binding protein